MRAFSPLFVIHIAKDELLVHLGKSRAEDKNVNIDTQSRKHIDSPVHESIHIVSHEVELLLRALNGQAIARSSNAAKVCNIGFVRGVSSHSLSIFVDYLFALFLAAHVS